MNTRQRKAVEAVIEIGSEPSRELSAAELARRLDVSKDSVHQLLLPLVRAGLLLAVRGRGGGYRGGEGLASAPVSAVLAPFEPPPARTSPGEPGPVAALEEAAERARWAVYEEETVGALAVRARAERGVLDWEI